MGAVDGLSGVSIGCVERAVEAASMRLDLRTEDGDLGGVLEASRMKHARWGMRSPCSFSCIVLHFYELYERLAKAASRYAQRVPPSDALRMLCAV